MSVLNKQGRSFADLKLENIMFDPSTEDFTIIDLDLGAFTLSYLPPNQFNMRLNNRLFGKSHGFDWNRPLFTVEQATDDSIYQLVKHTPLFTRQRRKTNQQNIHSTLSPS